MGGYAGLADASTYFNERSGEYDLPDEIDGVTVVGIEDEMVVGGEITWFDDADTIEFDSLFEPTVRDWLAERGWREPRTIKLIEQALADVIPTTG